MLFFQLRPGRSGCVTGIATGRSTAELIKTCQSEVESVGIELDVDLINRRRNIRTVDGGTSHIFLTIKKQKNVF